MRDVSQYSISTQLLALCKFSGVTPRSFEALLRQYGQPESIFRADTPSLMGMDGMTEKAADRIVSATKRLEEAESLATSLLCRDIKVKTRFETDYPRLLLELNDPPPLLFVRGHLPLEERRTVALVGAENATSEGIKLSSRLAKRFAREDIQIISSLSVGIDAAVHLGCRATTSESFAVLDHGFDQLQDPERMLLAIDIARTGGIISEYLPDQQPDKQTLVEANRLMVGMSQAVVVTEVYADSRRPRDILSFCSQIGKLAFFMIDPDVGALLDEESLSHAVTHGAIIIEGHDRIDHIIKSLV